MAHIRNFLSLVAAEKEGFQIAFELPLSPRFSLLYHGFALLLLCQLRALLAFPWQTAEPDVLQQLVGRNFRDVLQLLSLLPPQLERAHLSFFSIFSTVFFSQTSEIKTLPFL